MYCPTCGYSIDDNHKFCANCGVAAVTNDPNEEPAALDSFEPSELTAPQASVFAETVEESVEPAVSAFTESFAEPVEPVPMIKEPNEQRPPLFNEEFHEPFNEIIEETVPSVYTPPEIPQVPEMPQFTAPPITPSVYEHHETPPPPIPVQPIQKEKYFFGKGALVFCLALIGILSVTSAMFMGLYFHEIGGLR